MICKFCKVRKKYEKMLDHIKKRHKNKLMKLEYTQVSNPIIAKETMFVPSPDTDAISVMEFMEMERE